MTSNNIISSLGAGSGIDTVALVDGLIASERAGTDYQLDTKEAKLELQLSSYGVLAGALSTLETSTTALSNKDTFGGKNVAFPDTDIVTPTAVDSTALTGDFEIEVLALATAHSLSSTTFSSTGDAVGKGTLTFSFGAWDGGTDGYDAFTLDSTKTSQTITIDDSNNSLTGLRDAINDADFGVQASIIEDGGSYKLLMTAPSGAQNEIEITVAEDGGSPTNNDASDLSRFAFNTNPASSQLTANQAGQDASLKVNGLLVSRESNKIDDVIEGLDFTINKLSDGEIISITISDDKSVAEQAIIDFVTSYNDFLAIAEELTKPSDTDDEESTAGGLSAAPSAKSMLRVIQSALTQTITGRESSNFSALSTIGVMTKLDGTLEINEDLLSDAVDNNFDDLAKLFMPSTTSTDTKVDVIKYKSTTKPGSYAVAITTDPTQGALNGGTVDPLAAIGFQSATEDFAAPVDTSLGDYSFKISVDGTESSTITLTDTFSTTEEVRARLQTLINGDANLKGVGAAVDVTYDAVNDRFDFTSRAWGSNSKVDITAIGADTANLGLTVATGTAGIDVVGTIDGETTFGSGNILLPELSSDLYGMMLQIAPGATNATVTYSRGFGYELGNIINQFLATDGVIDQQEDSITGKLVDITEDREKLDTKMDKRYIYLRNQFIAMERILASFSETNSMLDGLTDRLPFTYRTP